MTTYKSQVGIEIILPMTVIIGGVGVLMAYHKIWFGLALVLCLVCFIAHMFLTTYYQIDNTTLRVRCGLFVDKKITLDSIKEIKHTRNPISSPATSLDRIVITYNKNDSVIISPKDKNAFIKHLNGHNPLIKVNA